MADDTRKVRVEEQLKIKIAEAKQLLARNNGIGQHGSRYVYCTVALDQEEIIRTPAVERNLNPFFGEDYQFQIPRPFRYLSIYVWDRDKHLKQDKAIGKIALKREELQIYNNNDHWFPLRPVDADSEVQGMILIKIDIEDGKRMSVIKRINDFNDDIDDINRALGNDYKENTSTTPIIRSESLKDRSTTITTPSSAFTPNLLTGTSATLNPLGKTKSLLTHNELNVLHLQQHQQNRPYLLHPIRKSPLLQNDRITPYCDDVKSRVKINIVECGDLTKKNGNCDPYIVLTACYSNNRKITKRTKLKKKTVNPKYDEIFTFDLSVDYDTINKSISVGGGGCGGVNDDIVNAYTFAPLDGAYLYEICVTVLHDAGMGEKIFLGEVKLPMHGKQHQQAFQSQTAGAYYFLQPRASQSRPSRTCATPPGTRFSSDNSLGSLRLNLVYTADHVFTLATYDSLLNLFLQSLDEHCPITTSAVYILGDIITNKTEIAQPLVRIFTYKNLILPIIKTLADDEISKLTDATTIFRGNTLVSKMMDEAMRLSGSHYLHTTLRPIVETILHERKPCEIDPTRVKDPSVIESNLLNLEDYVQRVFYAITNSAVRCPIILCQIFHDLRECAAKHFPLNNEVRYSVVSGFIFLRFFAPAILGPKLFDLTTEPLDEQTNRTLTLISKTIQSLGNLVSSRSAQQPCKEVYTTQLYKKFCTDHHIAAVKHFLEVISTVGVDPQETTVLEPVLLKEGMMTKRSQGRKIFGRHNFKQRYFRLTTQSLSYAKSKGKKIICDIPLSEILGVEKLNEKGFKMQNIFQIIKKDRTFYVQTSNCVEEKEWLDLLSKICQSNAARLEYFHSCAYINGMWTCCKEIDQNAKGCESVSPLPLEMELKTALDPARDLQRLHTLIINNIGTLEPDLYLLKHGNRQYVKQIKETLSSLKEVAYSIDQIHCKYKSILAKETKYGSRQAPIGDDNYLHMSRSGLGSVISSSTSSSSLTTTATKTTVTAAAATTTTTTTTATITVIPSIPSNLTRSTMTTTAIITGSPITIDPTSTPPSTPAPPPPPQSIITSSSPITTLDEYNEKSHQHFFIKNEYLRSSIADKLTQC